jgi:adenylosuccinate synthase
MSGVDYADVVCGLAWGDEGKGKVTSHLTFVNEYDYVCRWAGGSNAGHTIYVDGKKYKTHIVPAGVFSGVKSVIGPGCVLDVESFHQELEYLSAAGFDTSLVKVSPRAHIVTKIHKEIDKGEYAKKLGTTSSGIGPTYSDKALRRSRRAGDVLEPSMLWNEKFSSDRPVGARVLCEGAQGVWLDIDWGNYPYVTSSNTLPYAACSLGFPPQKIRNVWGCAKAYDTRSGTDPEFPESLSENEHLEFLQWKGQEYGVTTGRKRHVNWLNIDRLIRAINMTGTTHVVISKCDVLDECSVKKVKFNGDRFEPPTYMNMEDLDQFMDRVEGWIRSSCSLVEKIYFSHDPEAI